MRCCVSTDVGTWTNWLTFEPDPDHSPDAGTGLLSPISYRLWNFAALPRLAASELHCYAEFYVGENPTYTYWWHAATASRGFIHWAVGRPLSTECPSSFIVIHLALTILSVIFGRKCSWFLCNVHILMLSIQVVLDSHTTLSRYHIRNCVVF